jgi:hypothetical protein
MMGLIMSLDLWSRMTVIPTPTGEGVWFAFDDGSIANYVPTQQKPWRQPVQWELGNEDRTTSDQDERVPENP